MMDLRIGIRHYIVCHSEEGHPWWPEDRRDGTGLTTDDQWDELFWGSAYDRVTEAHEDAQTILSKAGITLDLMSIEAIWSDRFYEIDGTDMHHTSITHAGLIEQRATQDSINIFWIRGLTGPVREGNHGETFTPRYRYWWNADGEDVEDFAWIGGYGIVLTSGETRQQNQDMHYHVGDWLGLILAHELGHALGLPHAFYSPSPLIDFLNRPFEYDLPEPGHKDYEWNLMEYAIQSGYETENGMGNDEPPECIADIRLTRTQRRKLRWSLFARGSRQADLWRVDELGPVVVPGFDDVVNYLPNNDVSVEQIGAAIDAVAEAGFDRHEPLPSRVTDWVAVLFE